MTKIAKFALISLSLVCASLVNNPATAQSGGGGVFTILHGYNPSNAQEWTATVQSQINAGERFYAGGTDITSYGAAYIVSALGSYYLYVFAPANFQSPIGQWPLPTPCRIGYLQGYDPARHTYQRAVCVK